MNKTTIILILLIILNFLSFNVKVDADTEYHSFNEVIYELYKIADENPELTELFSIGKSYEGRDILVMKISDNPQINEYDEPGILYFGGTSGREWLSIEVPLYIIHTLIVGYKNNNETIKYIVEEREIFVIPCLNPDGRVRDSVGDDPKVHSPHGKEAWWAPGWRKNNVPNNDGTYGVDINRNFGYMWGGLDTGIDSPADTKSDNYRGESPFSERESIALRDFVYEHWNIIFAISYHTNCQEIRYPWSYTKNKTKDYELFHSIALEISNRMKNTANSTTGYTIMQSAERNYAAGTATDWLYGELGIYAFCIELFPGKINGHDERLDWGEEYNFFHPPSEKVKYVCEDNIEAALYIAKLAGNPYSAMDYHISIFAPPEIVKVEKLQLNTIPILIKSDGKYNVNFTLNILQPKDIVVYTNENYSMMYIFPLGACFSGLHHIWLNATSNVTNTSLMLTIFVPYENDVGIESINAGRDSTSAIIKNYGIKTRTFNTYCKIEKLRYLDKIEKNISLQSAIDLDGDYSDAFWFVADGVWSITGKKDTTVMLISEEIDSLSNPVLRITHEYYLSPRDFCLIDVWVDGIQYSIKKFTGNEAQSVINISLIDFADRKIQLGFRFSSHSENSFWRISNVVLTDDIPIWEEIWNETKLIENIEKYNEKEIIWSYNLEEGEYRITVGTTLQGDEYNVNNFMSTRITIKNHQIDALNIFLFGSICLVVIIVIILGVYIYKTYFVR